MAVHTLAGVLDDWLTAARDDVLVFESVPETGLVVSVERDGVRFSLVVSPGPGLHPLSPRELQIARLVASGATNRAIADVLEISLWTVSTHLRRIFSKLGVGSRAEMVARVFGHTPLRQAGSPSSGGASSGSFGAGGTQARIGWSTSL